MLLPTVFFGYSVTSQLLQVKQQQQKINIKIMIIKNLSTSQTKQLVK